MADETIGNQQALPTQEQIAEINKVSQLFLEFNQKLTDAPLQPIIWFTAGMCASIIDQAFNGDVDAFKRIFDDAIYRQMHLINLQRNPREPATSTIIMPN